MPPIPCSSYPDVVKRCFALSGVYDMKRFMNGVYDDNFYFNNPVDYIANMSDPWTLGHLCHAATSTSRPARARSSSSGEAHRLSEILDEPRHRASPRRLGRRSAGTTGFTGSIKCASIFRAVDASR